MTCAHGKRGALLLQTMATDLSRLNMALGEEPCLASSGLRGVSSPSISSMQTDLDSSGGCGGCASPTLSDCFNPFDSPSVQSCERAIALLLPAVLLAC